MHHKIMANAMLDSSVDSQPCSHTISSSNLPRLARDNSITMILQSEKSSGENMERKIKQEVSEANREVKKFGKEEKKSIHFRQGTSSAKSSSDNRSVVINAPPPCTKRQRIESGGPGNLTSTREIITALNMSVSRKDRIDAIWSAKGAFFHAIESVHDDEIHEGADEALIKHLAFLAFKTTFRRRPGVYAGEEDVNSLLDEASLACEALEMVYRASSLSVGISFRRLGPELLHALVTIIDGELSRRKYGIAREMAETELRSRAPDVDGDSESQSMQQNIMACDSSAADGCDTSAASNSNSKKGNGGDMMNNEDTNSNNHQKDMTPVTPTTAHNSTSCYFVTIQKGTEQGDVLLRSATKIIGHLARVGEATKPMAYFPGVLGCVLNLISSYWYEYIPWEARLSSLWTLANLACNTDNMQMMMCTPGLVRSLVTIGCRSLHANDPMVLAMEVLRARSIASRAILNLSWLPENKIPLSDNTALVELLSKFALLRKTPAFSSKSRTVLDILSQTRRHAVSAIRNLAAAPRRNKIRLCSWNNGHLLDVLTDVALNDPDEQTKDKAFAAIHNLAVHDTAEMMVQRPALVLALQGALLLQPPEDEDEVPIESPKSHASATLLVLERTITPDMSAYQHLKNLLEAVNPTVTSDHSYNANMAADISNNHQNDDSVEQDSVDAHKSYIDIQNENIGAIHSQSQNDDGGENCQRECNCSDSQESGNNGNQQINDEAEREALDMNDDSYGNLEDDSNSMDHFYPVEVEQLDHCQNQNNQEQYNRDQEENQQEEYRYDSTYEPDINSDERFQQGERKERIETETETEPKEVRTSSPIPSAVAV